MPSSRLLLLALMAPLIGVVLLFGEGLASAFFAPSGPVPSNFLSSFWWLFLVVALFVHWLFFFTHPLLLPQAWGPRAMWVGVNFFLWPLAPMLYVLLNRGQAPISQRGQSA